MYHYSLAEWLFFFIIYCMIGWVIESSWVSFRTRHLTNRGFMRGPWLPIYGSGAIVLLICTNPFAGNIVLTFLSSMIGASILEFVTGEAMEALFKVRYWDYSNEPLNIKGQVCLGTSLSWGVLGVVLSGFLHREIDTLVSRIPYLILMRTTVILSIVMLVDFTLSFKAAMDLRDIFIQMERAKDEMERIKKRMDVMVAVTRDELETRKNKAYSNMRDELSELKGKYGAIREHYFSLSRVRSYFQRSMLRGNPYMVSRRFAEALSEVKAAVSVKARDKDISGYGENEEAEDKV